MQIYSKGRVLPSQSAGDRDTVNTSTAHCKPTRPGNRTSRFNPEEEALLMEIIESSYPTPERKSIKATVCDVEHGFRNENERRGQVGLPSLRVPGRDAVRRRITKLGRLKLLTVRYDASKLRTPRGRHEDCRLGDRVEIDDWNIDLLSLIRSQVLHADPGADRKRALERGDEKVRFSVEATIDRQTKVCLSIKLFPVKIDRETRMAWEGAGQ